TSPITRSSRTNPRRRTVATTHIHKALRVTVRHSLMDARNPGQAASSRLAGSRAVPGAILVIFFSVLSLQDAAAHDPGLSSLTIQQQTSSLDATLTLAVKDAAQVADLDEDHDGIVTQAEFAKTRSQLETAVAKQLFIAPDGKVAEPQSIRSKLD